MSISKRLRFEILKRDRFRCVYCGAAPTFTRLQVDHIFPKSKGGSDDPSNLAASCTTCNIGKTDSELESEDGLSFEVGFYEHDTLYAKSAALGYLPPKAVWRDAISLNVRIAKMNPEEWLSYSRALERATERQGRIKSMKLELGEFINGEN